MANQPNNPDEPEGFKKFNKEQKTRFIARLIGKAESLNNAEASNRNQMTDLYNGDAPVAAANRAGRSKVITRECNETIGWLAGLITAPLDKDGNLFNVMPALPDDERVVDVAANTLSHVIQKQNQPVKFFRTWFDTGAIWGVGVVMLSIEDDIQVEFSWIKNLTADDIVQLLEDPEVQSVERKEIVTEVEVEETSVEDDHLPEEQNKQKKQLKTFDIRIKRTRRRRRFLVNPLPSEEFLTSDTLEDMDKARLLGRRYTTSRSALLLMDLDVKDSVIEGLQSADEVADTEEKTKRHADESGADASEDDDDISIFQIYVRKDFNGDGIEELTKFICVREKSGSAIKEATNKGETVTGSIIILHEEEVSEHPFITWHPVPFPHKFYSNGITELMKQIQTVKTEMTRTTLDTAYLAANPRKVINRNVNIDDVLATRLDHPIRVKTATSVRDAVHTDLTPFDSNLISLLEYIDQTGEMLTGVSKRTMGLDPSLLQNVTATATNQAITAGQAKIAMIGAQFRMAIKELGNKMLRFIIRYQDKDEQMKINGEWIPITTASWNIDMKVNLTIGPLGGSKAEAMNFYDAVVTAQENIIAKFGEDNEFVKPRQYYNALAKFVEAGGTEDTGMFFTRPPKDVKKKEPKPDPEMAKVQGELKLDAQKQQAELQIKQQEAQVKSQLAQQKMQAELQIKAQESQSKLMIEHEKMLRDQGLKGEELQAKLQLKARELQAEFQLKISELTAEIRLKDAELTFQSELAAVEMEKHDHNEKIKLNVDTRIRNPNTKG